MTESSRQSVKLVVKHQGCTWVVVLTMCTLERTCKLIHVDCFCKPTSEWEFEKECHLPAVQIVSYLVDFLS